VSYLDRLELGNVAGSEVVDHPQGLPKPGRPRPGIPPGPDLAGIASLAGVVHLETDDVVFEQGDNGDAFYMVVSGAVRITRGTHELAMLGSREGFGEMAILDHETRSATATAAESTTLLRIDQDSFDQLIELNPAVAKGIYRVLTARLRSTLAKVAAG